MKNDIYFWFDSPPKVGKGAFNFVANNWPCQVHYVFNNDFRFERKAAHWDDGDFGKADIIALYEKDDENHIIDSIFKKSPSAIHIVNGLTSLITQKIRRYIQSPNTNLIFLSERPVTLGSFCERIGRTLYFHYKYYKLYCRYRQSVKAFLPLGDLGVRVFSQYGWPKHLMYPFMYNPPLKDRSASSNKTPHITIRFLYAGRFYYRTKGVDVLMKACAFLKGAWSLDLVGGYGKDADKVLKWAEVTDNVTYVGRWDSLQVVEKMQGYDVVVIPTRYDGWNLLVNEAIHAGIGVISTDESVSHEIIEPNNVGVVVKANCPRKLANAMQYAIDHPDVVSSWKQNTVHTVKSISTHIVGQYLIDIINYSIYHEGDNPNCPWHKNY